MGNELYAIYLGLEEEIKNRFPEVTIKKQLYTHHYRMSVSRSWGNEITIHLLPLGFQIYRTAREERLFLYEDQDSIDNTLNYLGELLKFKYAWES